jgi:hypothetical protein
LAFAPCASSKVKDAIFNIFLIVFTIVFKYIIASLANFEIRELHPLQEGSIAASIAFSF